MLQRSVFPSAVLYVLVGIGGRTVPPRPGKILWGRRIFRKEYAAAGIEYLDEVSLRGSVHEFVVPGGSQRLRLAGEVREDFECARRPSGQRSVATARQRVRPTYPHGDSENDEPA